MTIHEFMRFTNEEMESYMESMGCHTVEEKRAFIVRLIEENHKVQEDYNKAHDEMMKSAQHLFERRKN